MQKNKGDYEEGELGMIEAPLEALAITVADAVENAIGFFLDAVLEPVGGEDGNESECEEEGADESEGHGVGHGMKEFSGRPGESINRQVSGDDDGDRIENRTIDVAEGGGEG